MPKPILVVCGLRREAAIAAGEGLVVLAGGGSSSGLSGRLAELAGSNLAAVVSFGLAGALAPELAVGDVVIGSAVVGVENLGASPLPPDVRSRLAGHGASIRTGGILGVDAPVLDPGAKVALHARTGAIAVDMESHLAAAFAARHDLPFAAIRIVSDAADRALPAVTAAAMRPDGSIDVGSVLRGLARDPRQVPPLIATARDAGLAFRALRRVRGLLGPRFGLDL